MTPEWQKRLGEAREAADLVVIANEYLATWTPEALAALPRDCTPQPVEDIEGIRHWAVRLAEAYCEAHAEQSPKYRQMLAFYMAALERHGQVSNQRNDGEAALRKLYSDTSRPQLFIPKRQQGDSH